MPLSGDVNWYTLVLHATTPPVPAPEEDGWGGQVTPTTDASGLQLNLGDVVRAPNPSPGQNNLENTPNIVGIITAFGGVYCTINVAKNNPAGGAVLVYNVPCNKCYQLYSAEPGNMGSEPVQ